MQGSSRPDALEMRDARKNIAWRSFNQKSEISLPIDDNAFCGLPCRVQVVTEAEFFVAKELPNDLQRVAAFYRPLGLVRRDSKSECRQDATQVLGAKSRSTISHRCR